MTKDAYPGQFAPCDHHFHVWTHIMFGEYPPSTYGRQAALARWMESLKLQRDLGHHPDQDRSNDA